MRDFGDFERCPIVPADAHISLAEDLSRIRTNPFSVAACRSIALNLCRFNKITNVADALYKNALSLPRLLKWKGLFLEN